jgi:molybdate transport system regulatory protein
MSGTPETPRYFIRVAFGPDAMMGPGKAALLERIVETGSIAAAGRAMGMSYKRAWQLVETMNAIFSEPVVISSRGGPNGGGAVVTEMGHAVLAAYRGLESAAQAATGTHAERLRRLLRETPEDD